MLEHTNANLGVREGHWTASLMLSRTVLVDESTDPIVDPQHDARTDTVISAFRALLTGIDVESLWARRHEWGFEVWVIVNNAPEHIRYQIYERQWELMQWYPNVDFKFELIDRRGALLSDLVTFENMDMFLTLE